MSYDQRMQVLDRHVAAENAHDLGGTLATLTADCEFVDGALGAELIGAFKMLIENPVMMMV